ncbi:MAG: hypothetical protein J6K17_01105 [Oscillospiraceae bacterium]|nr:hypothetical protein [Oscillospiraceae bacterium]
MEEDVTIVDEREQERVPKNSQKQTVIYTIISIAIFCIIYFGGNGLIDKLNRPYHMFRYPENTSEELLDLYFEYAAVSKEYGLVFESSRLEKNNAGYKVSVLFSGVEDTEVFADEGILFEYGNAIDDVDAEIYPYKENPFLSEYVVAEKYVDNDNPNNEILIFKYEDEIYVKYQGYGSFIPTDVKILFDGCEKVY